MSKQVHCENCGRLIGPILLSFLDGPAGNAVDITRDIIARRRAESEAKGRTVRVICQDCADAQPPTINQRPYTVYSHPDLTAADRERRNDAYERHMATGDLLDVFPEREHELYADPQHAEPCANCGVTHTSVVRELPHGRPGPDVPF